MGFPPIWLVPSHQNPNVLSTVKTQLVSLGMVQQKMKQAIIIISNWIMVSLRRRVMDARRGLLSTSVIDHEFRHNIVKVAVDPRGDITGQTHEKRTSICFLQ